MQVVTLLKYRKSSQKTPVLSVEYHMPYPPNVGRRMRDAPLSDALDPQRRSCGLSEAMTSSALACCDQLPLARRGHAAEQSSCDASVRLRPVLQRLKPLLAVSCNIRSRAIMNFEAICGEALVKSSWDSNPPLPQDLLYDCPAAWDCRGI